MARAETWKLVVKSPGLELVDNTIITDYRKLSVKERIMKMNGLTSKQYDLYVEDYDIEEEGRIGAEAEVSVEYTSKSVKDLIDSSHGWFEENKLEVGKESDDIEYRIKVGKIIRDGLNKAKIKPYNAKK